MTVQAADINSLYNISSDAIRNSLYDTENGGNNNMFDTILNAAVNNINETNGYISDKENEEIKLAMGLTEDTSQLSAAIQKAETALQYTLAVRDKLLSAYNEIMQIQI